MKALSPTTTRAHATPQDVHWGIDLATEHERYLAEVVYKQPVILFNYPKVNHYPGDCSFHSMSGGH
jgi:aspartyl/asparaginyl-tRNA synthetase